MSLLIVHRTKNVPRYILAERFFYFTGKHFVKVRKAQLPTRNLNFFTYCSLLSFSNCFTIYKHTICIHVTYIFLYRVFYFLSIFNNCIAQYVLSVWGTRISVISMPPVRKLGRASIPIRLHIFRNTNIQFMHCHNRSLWKHDNSP